MRAFTRTCVLVFNYARGQASVIAAGHSLTTLTIRPPERTDCELATVHGNYCHPVHASDGATTKPQHIVSARLPLFGHKGWLFHHNCLPGVTGVMYSLVMLMLLFISLCADGGGPEIKNAEAAPPPYTVADGCRRRWARSQ